jgi:hypothetical protein
MIKAILIAWLLTNFEPFQKLLYTINEWIKNKTIRFIYEYVYQILSCIKCTSFWLTLIMTLNIYLAILAAIITLTWEKINIRYLN